MSFTNRLKLLNNYLHQKPKVTHHPVEIGIEVTNRCTLNCNMCNRQEMTRSVGDMSWQLFTRIVDQTYPQAEVYFLYGLGEPLLHSRLFDMIDYCHQKGVPIGVSTNATELDQHKTEQLIQHPPDYLLLAIDAHTAKTYQQIRRGGDFFQVRANMEHYLKRKQEESSPTFAVPLFVAQDLNQTEAEGFKNYWKNKGASVVRVKPVTQMVDLERRGPDGPAPLEIDSAPKALSSSLTGCISPWRTFNITWQGDVYPCCMDTNCQFQLGNIKNQTLEQIWNGPAWQKLRASFKSSKLHPLCQVCQVRQPSLPVTLLMAFFPTLTVSKSVPYLEKLERLARFLPLWRN